MSVSLFFPAVLVSVCPEEACTGGALTITCQAVSEGARSDPTLVLSTHNLYWRNDAQHAAHILYVTKEGNEISLGLLGPGVRRAIPSLYNDVFRARAVRPGHHDDGKLMLEHQVSAVQLKDCDCQDVEFVDCAKPPFKGPRHQFNDPVVFENHVEHPVDLFWWNGTCEELISWKEVGGMQPLRSLNIQSTHGHTFRARNAFSRKLLMQHTLSDVVLRDCDGSSRGRSNNPLDTLRLATSELKAEQDLLQEKLASKLSVLLATIRKAALNISTQDVANHHPMKDVYSDPRVPLHHLATFQPHGSVHIKY
mmetsp:Transcript_25667/g.42399  ORF Transcript_25667/g.42399 Transcript_25667/m.42399 type:complete len:308 (-) Transcript_25667:537-1460(-)|eukprot:CAMPEP_0119323268 /NCGR_PEP_ID=MMETSP1333-20130426/60403_1 /TAXON_ID=418940 /ORGANISM="Scyphosphaera apsteinii, Strain RCC1455" /LENGTH=307 /DNA_ID=CAMNT_0007330669 /DNA_START=92 /DNA_END=1015 /DNA_ORIENTATION=-